MATTEADLFHALGDPTRRAILGILLEGECVQRDLCPHFEMSQPALSQHLRVLREAGLVQEERDGRCRIYSIRPDGLDPLVDWLAPFRSFWEGRLDALGDYLRKTS